MTADQSAILSHPMTIAVVVTMSGAVGWLVSQVFLLTKDNSTWKKSIQAIEDLLAHVTERQDKNDDAVNKVTSDLAKLQGEHEMMKNTGRMIANHNFKKEH